MDFVNRVTAITDKHVEASGLRIEPAKASYKGPPVMVDPHALLGVERSPFGDWRALCRCGKTLPHEQTPQGARRHHLEHADGEYPLANVLGEPNNESIRRHEREVWAELIIAALLFFALLGYGLLRFVDRWVR